MWSVYRLSSSVSFLCSNLSCLVRIGKLSGRTCFPVVCLPADSLFSFALLVHSSFYSAYQRLICQIRVSSEKDTQLTQRKRAFLQHKFQCSSLWLSNIFSHSTLRVSFIGWRFLQKKTAFRKKQNTPLKIRMKEYCINCQKYDISRKWRNKWKMTEFKKAWICPSYLKRCKQYLCAYHI